MYVCMYEEKTRYRMYVVVVLRLDDFICSDLRQVFV